MREGGSLQQARAPGESPCASVARPPLAVAYKISHAIRSRQGLSVRKPLQLLSQFGVSMSSLIHTMTMGTPAIRRLRATASTLYVLALGAGFALTSLGSNSSAQQAGLLLTGVSVALMWRSHLKTRAHLATIGHADGCWRALRDDSLDGIVLLAPRRGPGGCRAGWEIREANARAHALLRPHLHDGQAADLVGASLSDLLPGLPDESRSDLCQKLDTARSSDEPQQAEHALPAPGATDAPLVWLHHQIIPCEAGIVLVTRDITSRRAEAPRQAADALRLASRVIDEAGDALVVSDALDRIEMVNPAFLTMTGMSPAEVIGKSAELLGLSPLRDSHLPGVVDALKDGTRWVGESRQVCADGRALDTWLSVSTLRNEKQRVTQHIRTFSDISSLKAQQRELVEQARHDSLTGLPNRRAFGERLNQAMARARRSAQTLVVLYVDLDGFKAVNDQLGHAAGDKVLAEVARRLVDAVRTTDCVCRLAGDEFTVILEGAGQVGEVRRICQRILDRLSQPHDLDGPRLVTPSIGAAVYEAGESQEAVCERADAAMYAAKRAGKARFVMTLPQRSGESACALLACQG